MRRSPFGLEDFDIITRLRYRPIREFQFEQDKALRLKRLYLRDKTSMNDYEFKKDYPTLHFKNDEDVIKMSIFYFIELAMMD